MGVRFARRRSTLLAATAAGLSLLTLSPTTRAAVLVNDTWKDGTSSDPAPATYSENGADADADGDLESAWFQGGAGTLAPVAAGGPLRGSLPSGTSSSASWTTYFTPEAGQVTLAQGDTLRLTWKFSLANVNANNTSQNFRLALVDSPAAARVTSGAPGNAAYAGYAMFMNMGQTLGNSNPFQLRERAVATSADLLSTSGNWTALANGAASGNHGYDADTPYTFVMTLTRTPADALDITATMSGDTLNGAGSASVSFTDPTPNGFTYDTFAVRPSGATTTAETFDTTQFMVEVIPAPEPTSLSLLAAATLPLLRRRRRPQPRLTQTSPA